ncbi:DUF433 domain-containing protein [Microcoleus sp. Pol7_A1]|uniref:DUF433 domain-containing protein n=1 Tax=Microcoleus sp. Pol7_A1 TaxID=2818893 RepID=UPI004040B599
MAHRHQIHDSRRFLYDLHTQDCYSNPGILGGNPVFMGTRVPMKTVLDCIEAGDWLNEFLDHFPSVSRDRAISVLAMIRSPHNNI